MIVYEVNLEVDFAVLDEYRIWLRAHMAEILGLPGFLDATLFDVREPTPTPERHGLCVQYRLRNSDALDHYLREHAPRLRAEGAARFPNRFNATRRVMIEASAPS